MSEMLIKRGTDVQRLAWRAGHAASQPTRDPALAALEQEVRELRRLLAESVEDRAEAVQAARTQARKDAELAHKRADADGLAALEKGVTSAVEKIEAHVLKEHALALLLTQAALERVFGDAPDLQDLVTRAIRVQTDALRRGSVLSVRVSVDDFGDEGALAALGATLGGGGINIVHDPGLTSGECHIDLRLGQIELSISEHWGSLQDALRRLADAGEAA